MTLARRVLAPCVLAALAACGGGGGSGGGLEPLATTTGTPKQVVVQVHEREELDEICRETGATVLGEVAGTDYYTVELPPGTSMAEFLRELDEDTRVVDADEDVPVSLPEGGGSTIPLFGDDPVEEVPLQAALARVGAPGARSRATGRGVTVAVVDTGVVASHPLLAGHVAPGGYDFVDGDDDPSEERNFLDDDHDGLVDEGYGHGTFVASLVLAVAPDARILPIRALDTDARGTASSVANAIGWAVARGADVVNLSAGLLADLPMIHQAVANARQAGVLVVASAGNEGSIVDFPAQLAETEAVTATDLGDVKAPFAAYGPAVDLCAPGVDLIGAHPLGFRGTARWSGTSFSTALVSGACALVRERFPTLPFDEVLRRLEDTAVPVDAMNPAYPGGLGHGRLDVDAATR
jgi:subtilisin family serine protease